MNTRGRVLARLRRAKEKKNKKKREKKNRQPEERGIGHPPPLSSAQRMRVYGITRRRACSSSTITLFSPASPVLAERER